MAEKTYNFESFRLDANRKSLWHADTLVPLTPKAIETLLVLVRNPGEVIEKRELMEEVWPDTFVEEATLSQNILTLRKALGSFDDGKQFIVTVPRRGYRFVAPVALRNGSNGSNGGYANGGSATAAVVPEVLQKPPETPEQTRPRRLVWALLGIAAMVGAAAAFLFVLTGRHAMVERNFRDFRTTTVVSDASIKLAAISPDGGYVSLIERRENGERLVVRQSGEPNPVELASVTGERIVGAAFSPDSRYLFYTVARQSGGVASSELFHVPVLGGGPQSVIKDIAGTVSISKGGKLAFVRAVDKETRLIVAESDGSNERLIATRSEAEAFTTAAISPDGSQIVCAARSKASLDRPMELVLVDVATGAERSLTEQTWLWLGQSAWLADGSGIAVVGYPPTSPNLTDEVWLVSVQDGKARLLEAGVNGIFGVSTTSDGASILTVTSDKITSFVVAQLDDPGKEDVIVTKTGDNSLLQLGVDWSSDGRIVYSTTENSNADIFSISPDGNDRKRLVGERNADFQPRISGDGKHLFFLSNRSGQMSVWRSDADGASPRKLTDGSDVFSVAPSPDGRFVYYTARADSVFSHHLWRINSDGTEAVRLTEKHVFQPRISPDGKSILCLAPTGMNQPPVLTILNAETGEMIRQFAERRSDYLYMWLPSGTEALVFSRSGAGATLSKLSLETGEASIIREWPTESIYRAALSADGARLFYEKGVSVNKAVILSDVSR